MLEVTRGTGGYPSYVFFPLREVTIAELRTLPDLIFVDLQLPKIDGLGVARELRLDPKLKKTPIIILSGHDPSKYRQAAMDAGCNDYLLKPIDFDRLEELLYAIVPPHSRAARA